MLSFFFFVLVPSSFVSCYLYKSSFPLHNCDKKNSFSCKLSVLFVGFVCLTQTSSLYFQWMNKHLKRCSPWKLVTLETGYQLKALHCQNIVVCAEGA